MEGGGGGCLGRQGVKEVEQEAKQVGATQLCVHTYLLVIGIPPTVVLIISTNIVIRFVVTTGPYAHIKCTHSNLYERFS